MKKMNKKGFTIVELVIVIAVIAILSAVMIPTFSGMVEKANESAAYQEAANIYKAYRFENYSDVAEGAYVAVNTDDDADYEYYFQVVDGVLDDTPASVPTTAGATYAVISGSSNAATKTTVTVPSGT